MQVEYYGEGEPELALVGLVHGDEPCGAAALDHLRVRARAGDLDGCVLAVRANEKAAERDARTALWAESGRERDGTAGDLNRAYDGDGLHSPRYEERLAAAVRRVTEGLPVYDLHSTTSERDRRFAIFAADAVPGDELPAHRRRVLNTGVDLALDFRVEDGSGVRRLPSVEVEHLQKGRPGAVAGARRTVDHVLSAHGLVDDGPGRPREVDVLRVEADVTPASDYVRTDPEVAPEDVAFQDWEIPAAGFEPLEAGDTLAVSPDGAVTVRAAKPFTPVLVAGYEEHVCYAAVPAEPITGP